MQGEAQGNVGRSPSRVTCTYYLWKFTCWARWQKFAAFVPSQQEFRCKQIHSSPSWNLPGIGKANHFVSVTPIPVHWHICRLCRQTDRQTHTHTHTYINTRTHKHTHTHTHIHRHAHTCTPTDMCAYTETHTRTHKHVRLHPNKGRRHLYSRLRVFIPSFFIS